MLKASHPLVILVVDDDAHILLTLATFLKCLGYGIHSAESGSKALELLSSVKPNLILCDLMMPGMNGIQLREAMNELPGMKEIPFILMSATPAEPHELPGQNWDAFLRKPFQVEALEALISKYLAD